MNGHKIDGSFTGFLLPSLEEIRDCFLQGKYSVFKSKPFRHRIWLLGVFLLGVTTASHSFAGQMVVSNNGQPLGEAKISLHTLKGEQLAAAKTDDKGIVKTDIPVSATARLVLVTVTDNDGTLTRHIIAQPPGKPWHLIAMDTAEGIVGYTEKTTRFLKDAAQPIIVGDNAEVGSGARLKQKVTEAAGNLLGGAVGGLFGGSGGNSGGGSFPFGGGSPFGGGGGSSPPSGGNGPDIETTDDPVAEDKKRIFTDPATGTKIAVGTRMTPDGLLVSTNILESPDDGTFQTLYLLDPEGKKAGPSRYDVYEMYQDWKLTVHWTEDRYVNGKHVSHREGGWSEEGRNILGTFKVPHGKDGIWNKMGFSNAVQGIKGLGALFPIKPGLLSAQPMNLVVHITKPGEDTVTTVPFVIGINEDCPCAPRQFASIMDQLESGRRQAPTPPENTAQSSPERCAAGDTECLGARPPECSSGDCPEAPITTYGNRTTYEYECTDNCFDGSSRYYNVCAAGKSCVPAQEIESICRKMADASFVSPPLGATSGDGLSLNEVEQAYIHCRDELPLGKMCAITGFFDEELVSGLPSPPCADASKCPEADTDTPPACEGGECDEAQTGSIMDQLQSGRKKGSVDCATPKIGLVSIPLPPS